jgi:hypothetical protein
MMREAFALSSGDLSLRGVGILSSTISIISGFVAVEPINRI